MTRQRTGGHIQGANAGATLVLASLPVTGDVIACTASDRTNGPHADPSQEPVGHDGEPGRRLLRDASALYRDAAARGERLSQRMLARQLRNHGHRFPNEHLREIAETIGLITSRAA
jgi:hypothetical protein